MTNSPSPTALFRNKIKAVGSWFRTAQGCTAISIAIAGILWLNVLKGILLPGGYPLTHWMYHYGPGFINRGLIGTLMSPFYAFKAPHEIKLVIHITSLFVLFINLLLATLVMRKILLSTTKTTSTFVVAVVALLVVATSPAAAMMGNTTGFMDHFLTIYIILALFAIERHLYIISLILSMFGIMTHEMFLCYGLPVILLSLMYQLIYHDDSRAWRRWLRFGTHLLFPTLIYLFIALSKHTADDPSIIELRRLMATYELGGDQLLDQALFPITHNVAFYVSVRDRLLESLTDKNIVSTTYVATGFLILVLGTLFLRKKMRRIAMLIPFVAIAPLGLFLAAWDTTRFAALTTLHGFFLLYAFRHQLTIPKSWLTAASALLGILAIANSLTTEVWFFDWSVKRQGYGAIRTQIPVYGFNNCPVLFPNSGFEDGAHLFNNWTVKGNAFSVDFASNVQQATRDHSGLQGKRWANSAENSKKTAQRGELTSKTFFIRKDHIMFLLQSKESINDLYVSMEIEGKEIFRVTGRDPDKFTPFLFDVRAYLNKPAVLKVVDQNPDPDGSIQVDGFCYSQYKVGAQVAD